MCEIYVAGWPLAGLRQAWVYKAADAGLPPFERPTHYLACTDKLFQEMFLGRYTKVLFEGTLLAGGVYAINQFVRQEDWLEMEEE